MPVLSDIRAPFRKLRNALRPVASERAVQPDDVRWVYRVLLGRSPEDEAIERSQSARHDSIQALCRSVVDSPEFKAKWRSVGQGAMTDPEDGTRVSDAEIISSFRAYSGPGEPGFVTDFLGTKTRVEYVHGLHVRNAAVEDYPIPCNFHAAANEWAGTLRSVLEAKESFVALELGAGWGPWLTACAAACKQRNIHRLKLIGVEAAASHFEFLRQHFRDNNLDPSAHTLLHGAAAVADGFVEFPELSDPAQDYGATLFVQDPLLHRVIGTSAKRVNAYSIPTLLKDYSRVDLVHIDIQGSEGEVVAAARPTLVAKVRRLVIGTHGRAIEQQLLEDLSLDGWVCETDSPCRYAPFQGRIALAVDGCQVWRNPRMD